MILVTGGAGFIGSNFVLDWLETGGEPVVNLDKLTYAGNLENLRELTGNPGHVFAHGDIGDVDVVRSLLETHRPRAVVNFAAESHVDRTIVKFRELSDAEIHRYIEHDQPLDCAGGFKAEALGIALFDRIDSSDPTGLTGLPLSWLCGALRRARVQVP